MTRPDVIACARWLQERLGVFTFAVDHPGLPGCAGAHWPDRPCDGQRGKHPCGKWSRDSTSDPGRIRAALSRGLRNLGIDCGKSGLLVVDEDRPGAFGEFAASIGQVLPETFTVTTSKGAHFYFRQPAGELLGNGRGQLAGRGIDVRGRGGFVVAPGSVHATGALYTPVDPRAPVLPAPAWLTAALHEAPRAAGAAAMPRRPGSAHGRLRGLLAVVLSAKPGERNNSLYWAACRAASMIAEGDLDEATAVECLTRAGEAAGLGTSEVQATVASGLRGVMV